MRFRTPVANYRFESPSENRSQTRFPGCQKATRESFMETRPVRRPFGQTGTASKSFSHIPEEERDDLRPGTRSIRRECGLRRAGGNALLRRPQHRLAVVSSLRHIREDSCLRSDSLVVAPEERDDLRPGAQGVRGKSGCGGTGGNALLHRPQNRIIIVKLCFPIACAVFENR